MDEPDIKRRLEVLEDPHAEFTTTAPPTWWLRPLLAYQRLVDGLNERLGEFTRYLVVAVVVIGFGNAVARYVGRFLGRQLTSNLWFEVQWYLFATIFLLGFGYAVKNEINVRVDFIYADRSPKTKAVIDSIGHLISMLPFSVMALWVLYRPTLTSWGAGPDGSFATWRVWEIWERSPDPQGLPRAPIKTMLIVGFVLLLLQGLAELVKLFMTLSGRGQKIGPAQPGRVE
ncbi:MAG TPA: TRAP transporter small permease subunit [Euzebya sp.]|nr:TRAP transporter small permease subunit [Euzebya sp.]